MGQPPVPDTPVTFVRFAADRGCTCPPTGVTSKRRGEQALGAVEEAVAIRRRLAQDHPDAYRPEFARTPLTQARLLQGTGASLR